MVVKIVAIARTTLIHRRSFCGVNGDAMSICSPRSYFMVNWYPFSEKKGNNVSKITFMSSFGTPKKIYSRPHAVYHILRKPVLFSLKAHLLFQILLRDYSSMVLYSIKYNEGNEYPNLLSGQILSRNISFLFRSLRQAS